MALLDLFDLEHMKAMGGKKVGPHHLRPVAAAAGDQGRQRIGNPGSRSPEEVLAILRALGHAV